MSKVLTQAQGHIWIVTINRAGARNAIDRETADLLVRAFEDFEKNDELWVGILTGKGATFCSGADLKAIAGNTENALGINEIGHAPLGVSRLRLSKPVIAAIEGYAVAGGLELAIWCDLRVASRETIFGVYCRRFGVPLVDGGTIRLPRLIGHSRALDMILTGRDVNGQEAFDIGLVNRLVNRGQALKQAIILAEKLCTFPQTCMRSDRLSSYEQWDLPIEEAIRNETRRGLDVISSGETLAGAKLFSEKKSHS